jgi:hypothetical protein
MPVLRADLGGEFSKNAGQHNLRPAFCFALKFDRRKTPCPHPTHPSPSKALLSKRLWSGFSNP